MQSKLQIVKQQEVLGKDFKIYGDFENPLFLAKDVAEWIEYSSNGKGGYKVSQMLASVDDDEKIKACLGANNVVTQVSHGGHRANTEMWFLTEDGLYEVLMQSRKPIAKLFKKEVKQILKSIRKHGGYIVGELLDELLKSREMSNEYLNELKAEREYSTMKDTLLNDTIEFLEEIIPQAEYCETVLQCENCIPVTVIAKDYGMSAAAFNRLLRDVKIQYKVGGYYEHSGTWVLYSRHQGRGFTETKTFYKGKRAIVCTFWTQIGRKFVYEELKKYGILPEAEQSEVY